MYSYPTEALEPDESQSALVKRGRKISHANFFKAGVCQGQQLVCCVKTSALSTTIKVYEPMDSMAKKSKKSGFAKMLASSQDVLKPLKVRTIIILYMLTSTDNGAGILHPDRIKLYPLPTLQALRRLRSRLRSRLTRHTRSSITARPSRHVSRLRPAQGEHQTYPHRAHCHRVPAVLH